MQVYYIVLALVIVLSFLAEHTQRVIRLDSGETVKARTGQSGFLFLLAAGVLIVTAGFRYNVGTDFGGYYRQYQIAADQLWPRIKSLSEPGYSLLANIAILLGGGGGLSVFLASLFTIGVSTVVIYRHTDKYLFALLLFLFLGCWHVSFNAVRQCLAGACVFMGYRALKEKRFLRYLICLLIAFLFHRSSLLMIVFYFFVHRKVSIGNVLLLIAGAVAIVFSDELVMAATSDLLDANLNQKNEYLTTAVNVFRTLVGVVPAVFYMLIYRKKEKTEDDVFYLNLLLFHAAITLATANSTYYARYTIYTAPFLTIAIPELTKKITRKNRGIISFLILGLYFAFWLYEISNSVALNNFLFVWEQ